MGSQPLFWDRLKALKSMSQKLPQFSLRKAQRHHSGAPTLAQNTRQTNAVPLCVATVSGTVQEKNIPHLCSLTETTEITTNDNDKMPQTTKEHRYIDK